MKASIILILTVMLSACANNNGKIEEPVVSHQFVTKKIPAELLIIPEAPKAPTSTSTQKDVALWIIENEKRVKTLETQLKKIKAYNNE